jgi:hypothetical protein
MALKYFLVALDNDINGSLFKKSKNSPTQTLKLWDEYLINKYNKYDFLQDKQVTKKIFIEKFKSFISSLDDNDTGLFILNTHGDIDRDNVDINEPDGYNEKYQLFDQWLLDDCIRKCLNKKNEKAKFIAIIDTCYAGENFQDQKIINFYQASKTKAKNEIFFLGSSVIDLFINASLGKFNENGYSFFSYLLLETLKENNNINYEEWFYAVNDKLKFYIHKTQQIPVCLINENEDFINQIVFTNNSKKNQIPMDELPSLRAKKGIFNATYMKNIDQKLRTIFINEIINEEIVKIDFISTRLNRINIHLNQLRNEKL